MEEILHHLGCMKPSKTWDKLPTSTGWPDFFHQQYQPPGIIQLSHIFAAEGLFIDLPETYL